MFSLDEVLDTIKSSDKEAVGRQLDRLISANGNDQDRCRSTAEGWLHAVRWTGDDPAFAQDGYLSPPARSRGTPCADLYFLAPRIVRTQALCKARLRSPGAYPGIGEAECRDNDVIQNGVDTLQRSLLSGNGGETLVWYGMGDAFLLSGDDDRAEAAFTIWVFMNRRVGLEERVASAAIIDEQWLHKREEILIARALARVHLWNDEPVSDELNARFRVPWPEEPPPRKRKH